MTSAGSGLTPATAASPAALTPRTCSPHRVPRPARPRSGFHRSLLLVGDVLSQPPLGAQRKVSSRLCQARGCQGG